MKYRYRTDDEMKDSGVEWLARIPKEWEKLRLKNITDSIKNGIWGENEQKDMNDIPCIRIANFNREKNNVNFEDLTIRNLEREKQKDYLLNENDLLIEKSGGGEKQPVGFTVIYNNDLPAIYANFMARIKIKERHYSQYILYSFRSLYDKRINVKYIKQTTGIQNLDTENYFNEKIYTPPHQEQQKIASFLDKKTDEFDTIIEKKQSLITKLTEAKKSLISEVVTGTKIVKICDEKWIVINRSEDEMKDSSYKWMGQIPNNWGIKSFKHVLHERNEKNYPIKTSERLSLSIDKGVTLYSEKTTNLDRFKEDVSKYKLAHEGDIVLNSMNMIVGAVGVSKYFGCVSPAYYTYYDNEKNNITSKFCEYLFRSKTIKKVLFSMGRGIMSIDRGDDKINTCRLKISRNDLRDFKIPIPLIEEQNKIVDFLDEKTAKIDSTIEKINLQIEKLKEAKQSLISEAVTGKIEVLD